MKDAYITKVAKFLPNKPVENHQIEEKLGYIDGKKSRAKNIILRNNQIKQRYYAIDEQGNVTHNNAQLTATAIEALCDSDFTKDDIELLSCGTSTPDQLLPSHAAMVHGILKNGILEINSTSGVCCSGMNALKYGYMAIRTGQVNNAVCTGSERVSTWTKAEFYEEEIGHLKALEDNPMIAFEKDFLRWMLSDGSGAMLLEDKPRGQNALKIEWMQGFSYAHEMETCMYAGAEKMKNGELKPWSEYHPEEWTRKSVFAIKQDVKLLGEYILVKGVNSLKKVFEKHGIGPDDVDYYLPHISSYFFKKGLYEEMKKQGLELPWDKWFLNLEHVGNVGSASIYIMLEELVASGRLKKGQKILLSVPESARFSYTYAYLTVC
ncbi:beta-ketoacyl-ACP synthase III [Pareuzebyella sediminis]|uniref:beta-ketoacyl-ACP synthase III n=1 Tax=Pareuzebyella sediminis TaxID=2607998 RepID=UPI0011ECC01B|nr:beta-ketoacyl-ACP synthase III [Pareuzebyella sediminis]